MIQSILELLHLTYALCITVTMVQAGYQIISVKIVIVLRDGECNNHSPLVSVLGKANQ